MATLGSTAEPTTGQEWFGLNNTNHFAILLTMPTGGPWEVTRLGAWLAGKDEVCDFKLCIWSSSGSLLASSATITAASMAFALGNNVKYEADIGPVEVNGGVQVFVGFARDPADNVQFGTRSGTRYQKYSSTWPASMSGNSSVSAAIGAYIANYQDANTAPNAPTSLSPTGNAVVSSGTAPVVSGTRSDPDSGDYITAYQIVVYEDNGTTIIQDTGKISVSGTPTTFSRTLALNGAHKYVKWKARTWDKKGVAGPYSAQQRFYANAVPATPAAPTVETDDLVPDISGSFSDPGDTLAAVQIEVTLNASPYTSKWASGDLATSGTAWTKVYAGSALAWGTAYRARYRVKDSHGAYSSWSSWKSWTPVQPVGPDNNTPRTTNPRLSSLTPTLTVGHSVSFRNDEVQVNTKSDGTGTSLWYKTWDGADYAAVTSKARDYAGTTLSYGGTYYWRSRIENSSDGAISQWSAWHPIRINATPNSPSGLTPTGGVTLTTLTPTLAWAFSDPDADQGDEQSAYTIEVRNNASPDALIATLTGAQSQSRVYDGAALTYETTYKWRIKTTDAMSREGAYSPYQVFKVSQPPSAAEVTESAVTLATSLAADDIIDTAAAHGYIAGNRVRFASLTGGAGLSVGTDYWVIAGNLGATTFQVSTTPGGAPVNFTTDITAGSVTRMAGPVTPVIESTPTLDWTFSSPGAKAQQSFRIRIYDRGPTGANYADEELVYDSQFITSAATQWDVPFGVLLDDHDYRWEVTVRDTDLLEFTLA